MKQLLLIAILLVVAAAIRFGMLAAPLSGHFEDYTPLLVEQCSPLEIAPGTEDIDIDPVTRQAFISTYDRRQDENSPNRKNGGIYMLDLSERGLTPRLVSQNAPADFSPHGISFWRDDDGDRRLFVINHKKDKSHVIEMFDIDDNGALVHTESVAFDAMYSPNDVVAVGNRQFYATNDRRFASGVGLIAENLLGLPLTSVVYFNGVNGEKAKGRLSFANGINVSEDLSRVYVSEVLPQRVNIYDRDGMTGALTKKASVKLRTSPDNIDVAPNGDLYIGAHPKLFDTLAHFDAEGKTAASHVVRIDPQSLEVSDVFIALNGEINASSVGAVADNTLLVGAVIDSHIMICPMTEF